MMLDFASVSISLLSALGAGLGVYGAIRADLARAIALAEQAAKSADEAHGRMDRHIERHIGQ